MLLLSTIERAGDGSKTRSGRTGAAGPILPVTDPLGKETPMPATDLQQRLDEATTGARLLEHPFYRAWAQGTLTLEDLSFYSAQYHRQVEAFPGYLHTVADRLPEGPARATILANLRDEVEGDHLGLWLDFAQGVGAAKETVEAAAAVDETAACVASFQAAMSERSLPFALGMLYAYESQTPGVAATKIEGLRNHYGIDGPALEYFELHGELDIEHSGDLAASIADLAGTEAAAQEAEAGAKAGAEAVWNLLTGIAAARGIGDGRN